MGTSEFSRSLSSVCVPSVSLRLPASVSLLPEVRLSLSTSLPSRHQRDKTLSFSRDPDVNVRPSRSLPTTAPQVLLALTPSLWFDPRDASSNAPEVDVFSRLQEVNFFCALICILIKSDSRKK